MPDGRCYRFGIALIIKNLTPSVQKYLEKTAKKRFFSGKNIIFARF
jgi:hypothetical protein